MFESEVPERPVVSSGADGVRDSATPRTGRSSASRSDAASDTGSSVAPDTAPKTSPDSGDSSAGHLSLVSDRRGDEPLPADTPRPAWVRLADDVPWVDVLARTSGADLVPELLEVSPAALGDLDLVAALEAWERLGSWVAARHAEALGSLLARATRFGGIDPTAALLAAELGTTQRAAKDKLVWAHTLGSFPQVAEALELGVVDVSKARAICKEAMTAPAGAVQQVADLGLALVPQKTPPQLRRALRAAVLGLDPAAAQERAKQARADRRVEFRVLPDAMAEISAILPATDAMAVKTALDALARTTGTDDPRTFDQRRADYLASIFHAICDAGEAPLHPSHIGELTQTEAASQDSPETVATREPGNVSDVPDAGSTPAGRETPEVASALGAGGTPAAANPLGAGCAPTVGSTPAGTDGTEPHPVWRRLATTQRHRAHLHVTVGAGTLLGLDDHPGELAGYGPIPADTARMVAGDATWRALLTDPTSGTVTAVGEKSYRPGAVLVRTVTARDRTCTFLGCSRPAHQCDIDHRIPFDSRRPAAEQTCAHNLHALCRFHHNLKTRHGWSTTFDADSGVTTWASPLGTRHERHPESPLHPWEEWLAQTASPSPPINPCPCTQQPTPAGDAADAADAALAADARDGSDASEAARSNLGSGANPAPQEQSPDLTPPRPGPAPPPAEPRPAPPPAKRSSSPPPAERSAGPQPSASGQEPRTSDSGPDPPPF